MALQQLKWGTSFFLLLQKRDLISSKKGIQKELTYSTRSQKGPRFPRRNPVSYNGFQCSNCRDCGLKFHHIPRARPSGTPFCITLRYRAVGPGGLVWRKIAPVQRPQRKFISSDIFVNLGKILF